MQLWDRFLFDEHSRFAATRKNLFFFSALFDAYASGKAQGVCLTDAKQNSALLWGDAGGAPPLEFKAGNMASGWGTYVEPKDRREGIAQALCDAAGPLLKAKGFDVVVGTISNDNKAGMVAHLRSGYVVTGSEVWWTL